MKLMKKESMQKLIEQWSSNTSLFQHVMRSFGFHHSSAMKAAMLKKQSDL